MITHLTGPSNCTPFYCLMTDLQERHRGKAIESELVNECECMRVIYLNSILIHIISHHLYSSSNGMLLCQRERVSFMQQKCRSKMLLALKSVLFNQKKWALISNGTIIQRTIMISMSMSTTMMMMPPIDRRWTRNVSTPPNNQYNNITKYMTSTALIC